MRFARVAIDGRPVWGRVGEKDVELLSGSPLEGGFDVLGTVPVTCLLYTSPSPRD